MSIRWTVIAMLTFASLAVFSAAAQDPAKEDDKDKKENVPQVDPKTKEIIDRLRKNLETTETRLKKDDPYEETRQLQRDIVKDLDELIKKQEENDKNSSSSSSSSRSSRRSQSSQNKTSQSDQSKSGQKKNPMDLKDPSAQKNAGKDEKQAKGDSKEGDKKDKSGKGGQGNAKNDSKKEKNTIADLFKDIWGHLPQTKRLEMDAYSKERFMPKYEDLLRQYYRTIAEQGRRRDVD